MPYRDGVFGETVLISDPQRLDVVVPAVHADAGIAPEASGLTSRA